MTESFRTSSSCIFSSFSSLFYCLLSDYTRHQRIFNVAESAYPTGRADQLLVQFSCVTVSVAQTGIRRRPKWISSASPPHTRKWSMPTRFSTGKESSQLGPLYVFDLSWLLFWLFWVQAEISFHLWLVGPAQLPGFKISAVTGYWANPGPPATDKQKWKNKLRSLYSIRPVFFVLILTLEYLIVLDLFILFILCRSGFWSSRGHLLILYIKFIKKVKNNWYSRSTCNMFFHKHTSSNLIYKI